MARFHQALPCRGKARSSTGSNPVHVILATMGTTLALIAVIAAIVAAIVVPIVIIIANRRAFLDGKDCGEPDDWKRRRRR
jgi:hypothetical protein